MKKLALLLLLSCSFPVWAGTLEIDFDGNYFNVAKAMSVMQERAPTHLRNIEKFIEDRCKKNEELKICSFPKLLKMHADWTSVAAQAPFKSNPLVFRPGWTDQDIKAGAWNVDPQRTEELAQLTSQLAMRYLVSQMVLEKSFETVADFMGKSASPGAPFNAIHRPMMFAFLRSRNPLVQMGSFASEMVCSSRELGCRAVRQRLGLFLSGKMQILEPLLNELKTQNFGNQAVAEVYAQNFSLKEYVDQNWLQIGSELDDVEALLERQELKNFADFIYRRVEDRKNLMLGDYSLMDEMLAVLILLDLQRFGDETSGFVGEDLSAFTFSLSTEEIFREIEANFAHQFAPYEKALKSLL